jgi:hypothetical protein
MNMLQVKSALLFTYSVFRVSVYFFLPSFGSIEHFPTLFIYSVYECIFCIAFLMVAVGVYLFIYLANRFASSSET